MTPLRSKIAALIVLFFLGTFAGQINHLIETVRGKVETGTKITAELRETVTTINQAVAATADELRGQIADLQAKLAAGTATPAQVEALQGLVSQLKVVAGPSGAPGPPGPAGKGGPPGQPAAAGAGTTTTTTTPGGTTSSTQPAPTTSSTRPSPSSTTTTTTCAVGLGRLLKIGC